MNLFYRFTLFISLFLIGSMVSFGQTPVAISTARTGVIGSEVTIEGVCLNGSELGKTRFVEDATAGIACFPDANSVAGFENAVQVGTRVRVTGKLKDFSGLLEISPITAFQVIANGVALPQAKIWTNGMDAESVESQLVTIECVTLENPGGVFAGGTDFDIYTSSGETLLGYFRTGHPMVGTAVPQNTVTVTGVTTQYLDKYEFLPRTSADLSTAACFYISRPIDQSEIAQNGFRLDWQTNLSGTATVKYGLAPNALNSTATTAVVGTEHFVDLSGLLPGTIYYARGFSVHNADTAFSEIRPFCTKSQSSGQIKVYFTQDVDLSAASGVAPDGQTPQATLAAMIARIDQAQYTIDVAMYNNGRQDITDALTAAHNRGVRVRYVAAVDADNYALDPPPPFPFILGNDQYLMHNKFMAIDAQDANKAWVMSGSLNWSTSGIFEDYNNVLWIQDQSLARTYVLEFEEMWGSSGAQPNSANARFGSDKKDNTPHRFIIGTAPVESYFSPSDLTTTHLKAALGTADDILAFALYVFTMNEIGDAVIERQQAGVPCLGIIDDISDSGTEYYPLQAADVYVKADDKPGIVHHKYGIMDPLTPDSDPMVATGSHNWTFSAENYNDENTLIIRDERVAKIYWQEFSKRFAEIITATAEVPVPKVAVYPNPTGDWLTVLCGEGAKQPISMEIIDLMGRSHGRWMGEWSGKLDVSALPAGAYFVHLIFEQGATAIPFQKI